MRRPWSALCCALLLTVGCQSETELYVAFDFPPDQRAHAVRVEASIYRWTGSEPAFELTRGVDVDSGTSWPHYLFRAVPSTPESEEILVVAEATLDDGTRTWTLHQSVRARYEVGQSRQVIVRFDACDPSCPEPLRCSDGRCVDRCVATDLLDSVDTASAPRSCEEPCAPACDGELLLGCDDGVRVLRERCPAGCSAPDRCDLVQASNLGATLGEARLGELRVPSNLWLALRGDGRVTVEDRRNNRMEDLTLASSIERPVTVFGETLLTPPGARVARERAGGQEYLVVEVGELVVEADAVLSLGFERPVIFLVHGEARIDGQIVGTDGRGVSRPASSTQHGAASMGGASGGGGGAFATAGGSGGSSGGTPGGGGAEPNGQQSLVPLISGMDGGIGGGSSTVARGGGAVQISAARWICLGPEAQIQLNGADGGDANAAAGAGGGGSGGAALLEAPRIYVETTSKPAIHVTGGNGGRGVDDDGFLVARSLGAGDSDGSGGRGGRALRPSAGGGGGGAGRVRLNTRSGAVDTEAPCPSRSPAAPRDGVVLVSAPAAGLSVSYGDLRACHPDRCGVAP